MCGTDKNSSWIHPSSIKVFLKDNITNIYFYLKFNSTTIFFILDNFRDVHKLHINSCKVLQLQNFYISIIRMSPLLLMPFLNFIIVLMKVINVNMSGIKPFFSAIKTEAEQKYLESTNVSIGMHNTQRSTIQTCIEYIMLNFTVFRLLGG